MCLIARSDRRRVRGIAWTHLQKGHRRLHLVIFIALVKHLGGDFTRCGRRRPALRARAARRRFLYQAPEPQSLPAGYFRIDPVDRGVVSKVRF
ncbi:hypothetical protein CBD41_09205 [bacterium TMED181]|nr:hypothetical protein [Planctomycetota bacterium]OUW42304.1 MAG: hypothetical protein CBD41_09205 [bacterium TMED181]